MGNTPEDSVPIIDTEEKLVQALNFWKNFTFVPNYVKLQDAIDTILTDARPVEARHEYAPRWVVSTANPFLIHLSP